MEPGYFVSSLNQLRWTPPRMGKDGPHYAGWQEQYALFPVTGEWLHATHQHPIVYRCTTCWIYWIAPDERELAGGLVQPR
jgi:hypothetical protein